MITGSIVALVTPMQGNTHEVDHNALQTLIEWHIEQGTDALVAVGTTGESATLSVEEHSRVIDTVVKLTDGRIPVIAGTGANCTREAIALTQAAKTLGADACLLVTPYYNKPTQEGLFQHYKAVADAVNIDQILYNVPGRTSCDMLPETVIRLSALQNIIGIKEATGDLHRAASIIQAVPDNFYVYSGDDATARELILLGGRGNISVTANIAPSKMAAMCAAALSNDAATALSIDQSLQALHSVMFLESNPIPVKWALHKMGLIDAALRLPLTQLSESNQVKVLEAMKSAALLG